MLQPLSLFRRMAFLAGMVLAMAIAPPVDGAPLTLRRVFGWLFSPLMWALGVPWDQAQACVQALQAHGYVHSAVIGRVCVRSDFKAPVALVEQ